MNETVWLTSHEVATLMQALYDSEVDDAGELHDKLVDQVGAGVGPHRFNSNKVTFDITMAPYEGESGPDNAEPTAA